MENIKTFEELFLEENFEHLSKLCMKYAQLVNSYKTRKKPLVPSLLAADLGLTLEEYTELVGYYDELYQDEMRQRVMEDMDRGKAIKWQLF